MKKRFTSCLVIAALLCALTGCGKSTELSAISRNPSQDDGIVWFDDEAVALAGSMAEAGMSEEEKARAQELHSMAVFILDIINIKRAENGLGALTWSDGLESCASVRAKEIVGKFSHTRPNGNDWYTVNSELMWGENLAKGYDSAESVVDAWMASPSHEANIMAADFVSCSIAIYEDGGRLYFAQEFGY